jgi:hypothetical protein
MKTFSLSNYPLSRGFSCSLITALTLDVHLKSTENATESLYTRLTGIFSNNFRASEMKKKLKGDFHFASAAEEGLSESEKLFSALHTRSESRARSESFFFLRRKDSVECWKMKPRATNNTAKDLLISHAMPPPTPGRKLSELSSRCASQLLLPTRVIGTASHAHFGASRNRFAQNYFPSNAFTLMRLIFGMKEASVSGALLC